MESFGTSFRWRTSVGWFAIFVGIALIANNAAAQKYTLNAVHEPNTDMEFDNQQTSNPFVGTFPGYITFGADGLFYWLIPAAHHPKMQPLIIWLTGGPGCSSMLAALSENGPFGIDSDGNVEYRKRPWILAGNMLYIDQPFGTGFSVANDPNVTVNNEEQVSKYLRKFMIKFLKKYPQFYDRPLYVTGESYGGHYVPHFGAYLAQNPSPGINFKGIAVGNGWIQPSLQYPQYPSFGLDHGIIDKETFNSSTHMLSECVNNLNETTENEFLLCGEAVQTIIGSYNPYNYKLQCEVEPLCYNMSGSVNFLNDFAIQADLGVKKDYQSCNNSVYSDFEVDWLHGMNPSITYLLQNNYTVVLYYGDLDIICNWYGGKAVAMSVMNNLYPHAKLETKQWVIGGKKLGEIMEHDKFSFIRIYNAGHMVPMDQPNAGLAVITDVLLKDDPSPKWNDFIETEY
ncbi:putative Serine carboxypeptidase-like [Cardiosporidium cionae]|uniref:Carboxypeptidase n=1 Tax=Cardiosporidium cionae TaxID=476202 RepID=A0ABQ7J729_9APIC|nr:putative Serine carboxypeptidase-like [Cardiosporidium cionae]|eukprot:KAF8819784.1 putative Serine carboxypeptidase-like [Cardiosporidium cionae]